MRKDSDSLFNRNNIKLYFHNLYPDTEPYPIVMILGGMLWSAIATFVEWIIRDGRPSFVPIVFMVYVIWGFYLLISSWGKKIPLQKILFYQGSSGAVILFYFIIIVTTVLIQLENIILSLMILFIGVFLTINIIRVIVNLTRYGVISQSTTDNNPNKKISDKQKENPGCLASIMPLCIGSLGALVASFVFENFLPYDIAQGLWFQVGFYMFLYSSLIFLTSLYYYKAYLLKKFNLMDIKVYL